MEIQPRAHVLDLSLQDAASRCSRYRGPTRIWLARRPGVCAELFLHHDMAIHARFEDLEGALAVTSMLELEPLGYAIEVNRFPTKHSLMVPWRSLLTVPNSSKMPGFATRPVRFGDDEATARIPADEVRWRRSL